MTTLTDRLLELNRLHAGAVQYKSTAGDHNHLAAANRALFKAWPDIYREITRLTSEVERLEKNLTALCAWGWDEQKAKADALAEAAQGIVSVRGGVAGVKKFDALQAALTAFKEGK